MRRACTTILVLLLTACDTSEQDRELVADICEAYYDLRYHQGVSPPPEGEGREMHERAVHACHMFGQEIEPKVYKP